MNGLFILSILLVATATWATPSEPQSHIKIPQNCTDVFSVKVCNKIDSMATSLKLKIETAKEALKNAFEKGKTTVEEVIESCKKFYLEKVKTKTCEDFVSQETCTKLRNAAANLKIKAIEFQAFVKKALLAGKNKAIDVYHQVVEYYNNQVKGKSCEELLNNTKISTTVCTTLRKASNAVKVKVEYVTKIVRDGLIKGYNTTATFVKNGIQKIKDWASNFKCETLLNENFCMTLREYSMKVKVAFSKIMAIVRDLLVKGYNIATGFLKIIYKITDAFIDCEHIFTPDSCTLIKNKITSIGGKLSDFGAAVREYTMKAINKTRDIYHTILNYTKSKWCKWFKVGCSSTSKRSAEIVKRSSSLIDLFNKYKDMLSRGIAAAKEKLKRSMESLMDSMKIIDKTLRDIVKQAIDDGKIKYNELKELLKKMVDAATGKSNTTASDIGKTKRDLRKQLEQALKEAHSYLKASIKYLLTRSAEELKRMHNYIQALLQRCFDDKEKRDIDEVSMMEIMGEELVKVETEKISEEASKMADDLLDEAVDEIEEETEISEVGIEKRDLTSGLNKIKDFFGKVGDKITDVLTKLRTTNLDDIKAALEKAGLKLIGVAEDILKKIKQALDN